MSRISVVCCEESPEQFSRLVEIEGDVEELSSRVIEEVEQELPALTERELHNAAHHETEGPVTYLQQVHEGGFSVFVGEPGSLQEHFFGAEALVAFMDDEGPGHSSKVGPDGVKRTLRVLRGHLNIS